MFIRCPHSRNRTRLILLSVLAAMSLFWLRCLVGTVEARSNERLKSDRLLTVPSGSLMAVFEGFHDGADCDKIFGWAWDSTQPNTAISVDIYDGANKIATVLAGDFRPDLTIKGNGKHAFNYPTPASLKNGQSHSITVKFGGTNTNLSTTPKSLNCTLPDLTNSANPASSYNAGQNGVQFQVTVNRSDGPLPTASVYALDRVFFSTNSTWGSNDTLLWESNGSTPDFPVSVLNSSGTKTVTATVNIPNVAAGTYYIIAFVDPFTPSFPNGFEPESNENNNIVVYPVTINAPCTAPAISTQPSDQTINSGQQAGLSVSATGTSPLSYQWFRGSAGDTSNPINGATSSSFTTPSLTASTTYWVRISNSCGNVNSRTVTVNVNGSAFEGFHDGADCDKIFGWAWDSTQPNTAISVDIYDGANKIATVLAGDFRPDLTSKGNGKHAFNYPTPASLKNGQSHSITVKFGGTNTNLSTTPKSLNCTLPDLTNSANPASSYNAGQNGVQFQVTVNRSDGPLPTASVYALDRVFFSTNSTWGSNDTLLWESNGSTPDFPVSVLNSSGTKTVTATVNIPNVAAGTYYIIAFVDPFTPSFPNGFEPESNENNNIVVYPVTINAPCTAPAISTQPSDQTINSGQQAGLSVSATGTSPLSYQWFRGSAGDTSNPINGATSSSFTTPSLTASTTYWVRISNSCGNVNSRTVTVNVNGSAFEGFHDGADCDKIFGWAWDSTQPNTAISVDIYDGANKIATVLAGDFRPDLTSKGNGKHAFNYPTPASLKNGQSHSITVKFGGTNTNLSTTPKSLNCTLPDLTNSANPASSYNAGQNGVQFQVTVNRSDGPLPTASVYALDRVFFSTNSTWGSNDTLLWESNGSTPDFPVSVLNSSGTKTVTATVNIPNVAAGTYYIIAFVDPFTPSFPNGFEPESNENNNIVVYPVTINAPCTAPAISTQPSDQTINSGQQAGLSVSATGTSPLSYQWFRGSAGDTSNPINGATSSSFTTPSLTASTTYWVRISNSCGNVNSRTVTVNVNGSAFEGFHDGADCDKIFGWAWDSTQPNTAISVDIYDGANKIATVLAGDFRPDLTSKGNGKHAFNYPTPASLKNGQSHSITVKFGGTNTNLSTTPKSLNCTLPDLTNSANPASSYNAGQNGVQFQVTVNRSDGPLPTASVYALDRVFFSTNSTWGSNDTLLWESNGSTPDFPVSVLNSSGTKTVTATVNIPNVAAGTYYIIAFVDPFTPSFPNGFEPESNENNNIVVYPVTINAPCTAPAISTQPSDQTINSGQQAGLSVSATGTSPLSYQWFRGSAGDTSNPINGATSSSFTTPSLTASTTYWVRISNSCGNVNSRTVTVNVNGSAFEGFHDGADCDKIFGWAWDSTQPNTAISVDIYDGANKIATVLAGDFRPDLTSKGNGKHAFNYPTPASLKNGQSHSITVKFGGTNTNLSTTPKSLNCTLPDLTNSANPASSYNAGQNGVQFQVTVNRSDGPLPTASVYALDRVFFSTNSTWGSNDTLLWESNGSTPDFPVSVLNSSGTKTVTATVNIPNVAAGTYYIIAFVDPFTPSFPNGFEPESNENNNIVVYPVTINAPCTAPAISTQPSDQTINSGQQAGLSVSATGTSPLSYQWFRGSAGDTSNPINGATSSSFTTPSLTASTTYWVRISNSCGNVNSRTVTVNVNGSAFEGFHDGADCDKIFGWAWDSTQPNTAISVDIYDGANKIATVLAGDFRPDLTSKGNGKHAFNYPTPASLKNGQSHSITVKFGGTNTNLSTTPKSLNCTLPDLTNSANPASSYNAGQNGVQFQVTVNRSDGPLPTASVYALDRVFFSTNSTWGSNDTLLWESNGSTPDFPVSVLNSSGTKTVTATVNIPNVAAGTYYILAFVDPFTPSFPNGFEPESNENNNIVVYPVTINAPCTAPAISTQPSDQTINSGQQAGLSVSATGTSPLSYQWFRGSAGGTSNPINGATSSSFTTPSLTASTTYWVRISNSCGNVNSRTVTVNVNGSAFEGFHDGADCDKIFGWAWDSTQPNTAISVDIYDGANKIATVLAGDFRPDLTSKGN